MPVVTSDVNQLLSEDRPVTLIITFRLRDEAAQDRFVALCTEIGTFMARRSGFVSAHLYRARTGAESREFIQVANWTHAYLLADAQSEPEIRWLEGEVEKLVVQRRRVLCNAQTDQLVPLG